MALSFVGSIRWSILAVLLGCGGDGDGGDEGGTGPATSMAASDGTTVALATTDDSGPSSIDGSAEGSAGGSQSTGGSDADATTSAASDGGDTSGEPACDATTCAADEYCLIPCCGGPSPACYPWDQAECPRNAAAIDPARCGGCQEGTLCCQDGPCVPPPPYCRPIAELNCFDVRGVTQCTDPNIVGGCNGPVQDGVVSCRGCK